MKQIILCFFLVCGFLRESNGQSLNGLKIYINPGHGGFDSNDRNVPLPDFAAGDTAGFWESKSNLYKGLYLKKLLEAEGAQVFMSRVQNRTADDRSLTAIAEEANANRVDFMISIHSNAFNTVTNYVLELYHGKDNAPYLPQSMDLANLFWDNLISNQVSYWTYQKRNARGDQSFSPPSGYGVLRPLTVPGLISEGSFHDYTPETYRLMNNDYRQLEAWHFFRAFCQYYGGNPGSKGKIAGFIKDSVNLVSSWSFISGSKDQWLPVNGAKVTLEPGSLVYTTDALNNGFFLFDNLEPGTYRLKLEATGYKSSFTPEIRVDSAKVSYFNGYLVPHSVDIHESSFESLSESGFVLFPNPVQSELHIRTESAPGNYTYQVSDISGRKIKTGKIFLDKEVVLPETDKLVSGIYVIRLTSNDRNFRGKFIKQ
jgi:N-acetylmuramoyl-L-alanine amidase